MHLWEWTPWHRWSRRWVSRSAARVCRTLIEDPRLIHFVCFGTFHNLERERGWGRQRWLLTTSTRSLWPRSTYTITLRCSRCSRWMCTMQMMPLNWQTSRSRSTSDLLNLSSELFAQAVIKSLEGQSNRKLGRIRDKLRFKRQRRSLATARL